MTNQQDEIKLKINHNKTKLTAYSIIRYYEGEDNEFEMNKYIKEELKNTNRLPVPPNYILPKVSQIRKYCEPKYLENYTDKEINKIIKRLARRYDTKLAYYKDILQSLYDFGEKKEFEENIRYSKSVNIDYMKLLEMLYQLLQYLPSVEYITKYFIYKKTYHYFLSDRYYDEVSLEMEHNRHDKWGTMAHFEGNGKNITEGMFHYDYQSSL